MFRLGDCSWVTEVEDVDFCSALSCDNASPEKKKAEQRITTIVAGLACDLLPLSTERNMEARPKGNRRIELGYAFEQRRSGILGIRL